MGFVFNPFLYVWMLDETVQLVVNIFHLENRKPLFTYITGIWGSAFTILFQRILNEGENAPEESVGNLANIKEGLSMFMFSYFCNKPTDCLPFNIAVCMAYALPIRTAVTLSFIFRQPLPAVSPTHFPHT